MIEPDFLEQLDRFQLALKKNSIEAQEGEQASDEIGQGMIFQDHKKYVPGDDIRKIDWKAYARTDEFFVKRFEEEKSITVHILIDRSSSMDYGTVNKYEFAAKLGLGLAHMTSNTNDRFRFAVFSETVTDISSGRRNANMGEMIDILNDLPKTPESYIDTCLTEYSKRIKHKSVVIVISDFLIDIDKIRDGVESLKATDVLLVNVLDVSEIEPDLDGDLILKDAESPEELRTYVSGRTREDYKDRIQQHMDQIEEIAFMNGAKYLPLSTGDEFFNAFLKMWNVLNR